MLIHLAAVLLPDPGHARQVVAALPDQGGQVGVAGRSDAVAFLDHGRRHPDQLGDPAHRIEDRHLVGDQLQGVSVTAADHHLPAGQAGLPGQRGDHVVRLVVLLLQDLDPHRGQDFLDQRDLTGELLRGGRPVGLVLREGLTAEGLPGDVERDRDVVRLLVPQDVDQHGREAVDGVRGLPGGRGEVLRRQREEGSVGHRMAVHEQESGPVVGGLAHGCHPRGHDRQREPGRAVQRLVAGHSGRTDGHHPGRGERRPHGRHHAGGRQHPALRATARRRLVRARRDRRIGGRCRTRHTRWA